MLILAQSQDEIDKKTLEIKREDDDTVYKSLQDISDALPDNSPRFIVLSYPLTLVRSSAHPAPVYNSEKENEPLT